MKKTYLRPEIETVNVQSVEILASSWNDGDGTGDMNLNDGTATNPISESKEFNFWN